MMAKDRKEWVRFLEKWTPYFMMICTLIGAALGSWLAYVAYGEFPYEVLIGGAIATIILAVVQVIKQKRKKDNLPEADERVIRNMSRFFAIASHLTLAVLFIGLAIFTFLGNETISLLYLWISFFAYIWIVGIGTFIIKFR